MVAVQGFGLVVVQEDFNMNENFLSGSLNKKFTIDTRVIYLRP